MISPLTDLIRAETYAPHPATIPESARLMCGTRRRRQRGAEIDVLYGVVVVCRAFEHAFPAAPAVNVSCLLGHGWCWLHQTPPPESYRHHLAAAAVAQPRLTLRIAWRREDHTLLGYRTVSPRERSDNRSQLTSSPGLTEMDASPALPTLGWMALMTRGSKPFASAQALLDTPRPCDSMRTSHGGVVECGQRGRASEVEGKSWQHSGP